MRDYLDVRKTSNGPSMYIDIVAIADARTPFGSCGGTLRNIPVYELRAAATRSATEGGRAAAAIAIRHPYCRDILQHEFASRRQKETAQ